MELLTLSSETPCRQPATSSTTPPAPLPHLLTLPPTPCLHCPLQAQLAHLRQQAAYWKAMHRRAKRRDDKLQLRVAELEAENRDLRHRLFGRRSETNPTPDTLQPDRPTDDDATDQTSATDQTPPPDQTATAPTPPKRPRGQQPGHSGHGRRNYDHLPTRDEVAALPPEHCRCDRCGLPFAAFPGTDDTTILEIDVQAHRRRIHRQRYRPTCDCGVHPGIVTAPPPPRLLPKSIFGISLWVTVLLDKYLFYRPTYRLLADLRSQGLDLAQGALTDGLQRLLPLFEPLYEAFQQRQQQQDFWHADETRWQVFATVEGKVGYRWYLWLFQSADTTVFVLAAGRSHTVPEEHFGPVAQGILVVDRFKAYPAMAPVKEGRIILALCWAHQRRDFIELARSWPAQQNWALGWLDRIQELYALNQRRLALREDSEGFEQRDRDLRAALDAMAAQAEQELAEDKLQPACRKVLESLGNHWTGLTVFVEHPEVPMDNNQAERVERGPVVGRKNYYGSGAVWSGRLAALLFSLFGTLEQWGLNPRLWLTAYLTACADNGGQAPADVSPWLPWHLTEEQREAWSWEAARPSPDTS